MYKFGYTLISVMMSSQYFAMPVQVAQF